MSNLIFQEKYSISKELCNDIIDNYNENTFFDNSNHIHILNDSKITNFLLELLKTKIKKYFLKINNNNVLKYIKFHNISFIIDFNNANNNLNNSLSITKSFDLHCYNIIKFVWFLNDYDGEIVFWNKYAIKPHIGKLLIFPVSWCFPYEEIIKCNSNKYILYGYINIK